MTADEWINVDELAIEITRDISYLESESVTDPTKHPAVRGALA